MHSHAYIDSYPKVHTEFNCKGISDKGMNTEQQFDLEDTDNVRWAISNRTDRKLIE